MTWLSLMISSRTTFFDVTLRLASAFLALTAFAVASDDPKEQPDFGGMGTMPSSTPADNFAPYAALGSAVAKKIHLDELNWTEEQFAAFVSGLRASYSGQAVPMDDRAAKLFDEINRHVDEDSNAQAGDDRIAGYLKSVKEGLNMMQTKSGLLIVLLQPGNGPRPRLEDTVQITFTAKSADGTTELPQLGGRHLVSKVQDLLPGLAEGLRMLALGGKALIVVPPKLTFAKDRWPYGVEKNSPIWFQIELEDIQPQSGA